LKNPTASKKEDVLNGWRERGEKKRKYYFLYSSLLSSFL